MLSKRIVRSFRSSASSRSPCDFLSIGPINRNSSGHRYRFQRRGAAERTVTVRNEAPLLNARRKPTATAIISWLPCLSELYTVEVRVQGFKTQVADQVTLEVAKTVVQNFQMDVGAISEQVLVSSDVPVIETATTSVGTVINQRTVQEIPLNGRHFVDLGLLIPGSVTPPQNGFLTAPLRGQGSFAFNTAGNREDTVNFMINGVNLNDMVQNQITFQPSINTVQEFKVDNSTFSAEYGRNSGAIVNIATRSGTTTITASSSSSSATKRSTLATSSTLATAAVQAQPVWLQPRWSAEPAVLRRRRPPFSYNGKNRTFFFFSYEGLRQRQGLTLNSNVLTDAQRAAVTNPTVVKLLPLIPCAECRHVTVFGATVCRLRHGAGRYRSMDRRRESQLQRQRSPARLLRLSTRQARRAKPSGQHDAGFWRYAPVAPTDLHAQRDAHLWSKPDQRSALGLQSHQHHLHAERAGEPGDFGTSTTASTSPSACRRSASRGFNFNIGGPAGFPQGTRRHDELLFRTRSATCEETTRSSSAVRRRFYNNNFTLDTGTFVSPNVPASSTATATRSASRSAIARARSFKTRSAFTCRTTSRCVRT